MATQKSIIADAELNVLKVLWQESPLTARDIAESLYQVATSSSIGTVQKLISRLEEKGMIIRNNTRSPHQFTTSITQEDVAGMQLDEFASKLSEGSLSPFVLHLVNAKKLSSSDKDEIRKMLDES